MVQREERVHVALCFSDPDGNYSRYILTEIAQIISHTEKQVIFHLIHDSTLRKTSEQYINQYITQHNAKVNFYDVSKQPEFEKMKNGTLYRLFLPRLLKSLNKVIYLDADIFVMKDIYNLWKIDIANYTLAAARDIRETQSLVETLRYYKRQGLNSNNYFNAGVLIMNLDAIRVHGDLPQEYLSYIHRFPHALMLDQDFLNYAFSKTTKLLPAQFNFIAYNLSDLTEEVAKKQVIVHMAGFYKAWNCRNPFIIEYFCKYYAETFPEENRIEYLCRYMSFLPMQHVKKMQLNQALVEMYKSDGKKRLLSLKCILKGILNDQMYEKVAQLMTYIRLHILYSFYYCYIRK